MTSLRRDVVTDGRHAQVAYTDDWREDAARRDFTINALYMDRDGQVTDFFGGLDDLAARRVRFVGAPEERIREDVLRILRYFRFLAQIGGAEPDSIDTESLRACRMGAPLMLSLSGERLWRELAKWLAGENPVPALRLAVAYDIFKTVLPSLENVDLLAALIPVEQRLDSPSPVRRLAALCVDDGVSLAVRLRLSKNETRRLTMIQAGRPVMNNVGDPLAFRQLIYALGQEVALDLLLLELASGRLEKDPLIRVWREWEKPVFPLKGKDVLALGLNQGPQVGALLKRVEEWWQSKDFKPDQAACLAFVRKLNADSSD